MKQSLLILFALLIIFTSCDSPDPYTGTYRGVIETQGGDLVFSLFIEKEGNDYQAKVVNGKEELYFSRVELTPDSFALSFEFFDSHLNGTFDEQGNMSGAWTRTFIQKNDSLAFSAEKGNESRYELTGKSNKLFAGSWQTTFKGNGYEYKAMGYLYPEESGRLTGTFITEYGDFRFLEGSYYDSSFTLSVFDAAHAFLFEGNINQEDELEGKFWSRGNPNETFSASRGSHNLQDPLKIAGVESIGKDMEFNIQDINGEDLTADSDRFKNKPIILYVFGTWCPNCADQAELLREYAEIYKDTDLEIIGLAFEYTGDRERDIRQIREYKKRWDIPWTLSLGGITSKRVAANSLPFTDEVLSFPSTFFADRNHKIKAVHVGINGPATGKYYLQERERFKNKIDDILSDQ